MFNTIKSFFTPPFFEDEEKTRSAKILHQIATATWALPILALSVSLLNPAVASFALSAGVILAFTLILITLFNRMGRISLASILMVGILIFVFTYLNYFGGGEPRPFLLLTVISIVIGGLLLGSRGAIFAAIILALQHVIIVFLAANKVLVPIAFTSGPAQNLIVTGTSYVLIGFLLNISISRTQTVVDRLRKNESDLEQRVEERTQALATSAEISRRISTILDKNQLVHEVVEQIKSSFGYYHAHIYLMDEQGKELLMAGGTGDAGQIMLARRHKIPVGKGLVGLAAESGTMIRVSDTTEDPDWLPNPLLPETKSEIAIPIVLGEKILGVLDVQHNVQDGLSEQDAVLLQSIAYQVAVAVRNAQVFSEAQQQAEREALINEIGRKIQNTASVEQALQVAARELGQALGARDSHAVIDLHGTLMTKAK